MEAYLKVPFGKKLLSDVKKTDFVFTFYSLSS